MELSTKTSPRHKITIRFSRGMEETKTQVKKMEEEEEDAQAEVEIWNYVFGYVRMAVVKCAIELGIADAIENNGSPMTLTELSSTLSCEPSSLHRIMRFLVHYRIFKEKTTGQGSTAYEQTPISRRLMKNGPKSMASLILLESSPVMLAPWHSLGAHVLANWKSAFNMAHGKDVWSYAAADPSHSHLINDAMACNARVTVPAIIEGCPEVLEGIDTLVDVGGGNGTALKLLVKAFPWIRGINFDLPHVISDAEKCDGVEHVGGDMFDAVPKADAAFFMQVLHDWGDDECVAILKNCKEAIPKDKGKVIIAEVVIEEEEEEEGNRLKFVRLMLDMVMMAHANKGKERTLNEWEYILGQAGFSRYNVKAINAVQSVIEAYP